MLARVPKVRHFCVTRRVGKVLGKETGLYTANAEGACHETSTKRQQASGSRHVLFPYSCSSTMQWRLFPSLFKLFTLFAVISDTLLIAQAVQVLDSNDTSTSTQSADSSILDEIYTLQNRRIHSILGTIDQSTKKKIPAWCVIHQ